MSQKPKPKAYGLIRASTWEQEISPKAQVDIIKEYAKNLGDYEYVGCLDPDRGVSATRISFDNRPAIKTLNKHLKPGDCVILWRFDRAVRGILDLADLTRWKNRHKIKLFVTDFYGKELDLDSDEGFILSTQWAIMGRMEARNISSRVKSAVKYNKSKGVPWHGRPVLGYTRKRIGRRTHDGSNYHWLWSQDEWDLMLEIYQRRQKKDRWETIRRDFDRRRVRSADGKLWPTNSYHRIRAAYRKFVEYLESGYIEIVGNHVLEVVPLETILKEQYDEKTKKDQQEFTVQAGGLL